MKRIRFCEKCKIYTLKYDCPYCGEKTVLRIPPKYSPDDKFAKYRRKLKKEILIERGLL